MNIKKPSENFKNKDLISIYQELSEYPQQVTITGETLTLAEIIGVSRNIASVNFTTDPQILQRIKDCYDHMMSDIKNGVPVYGCNTGFGGRAAHIVNKGTPEERIELSRKISEGIAHVDISVGPLFSKDIVRGAMLIRINMLMRGVSGIKIDDLDIYRQMLNQSITPQVNQYGGIGASGDLAHNGRILSAARQLPAVKVWDRTGETREAKDILQEYGIPALQLDPKAGLAFVNGDNFSTSLASHLAFDTLELFLIHMVIGAMMIEVLKGSDRCFHPLLGGVRAHEGQEEVASFYRYLLSESKLAYQEMKGHEIRPDGIKVQDGYSIRCLSQYHAVNVEKIKSVLRTIEINANSVSDNPLWVSPEFVTEGEEAWHWVTGGNFIASHMVEAMDGLRKTLTQIVKLNDRHLARLVSPHENNGLPPNLSTENAITQCAFKGVQIQSGMFDVYSSLLSIPVSTFFGVHEEANQDITSHALTSGILGIENLRIARYSTAQNLLAVVQAVDLRGGKELLSPKTRPLYEFVRNLTNFLDEERPLNNDINTLYESLIKGEIGNLIRKEILPN